MKFASKTRPPEHCSFISSLAIKCFRAGDQPCLKLLQYDTTFSCLICLIHCIDTLS
jgi:hypothetical protein